jgi:hypothetical protein
MPTQTNRSGGRPSAAYARRMLTFLIILAIVIAGVVVWRLRVPLLAKLLGQSESRIRQINRKR